MKDLWRLSKEKSRFNGSNSNTFDPGSASFRRALELSLHYKESTYFCRKKKMSIDKNYELRIGSTATQQLETTFQLAQLLDCYFIVILYKILSCLI